MRIDPARSPVSRKACPEGLGGLVQGIVSSARFGDYGDAASKMNLFVQALSEAMESGKIVGADFAKLQPLLGAMLKRQEDVDWVAVADILEFELGPLLRRG